jgi:putative salt-induced outer membrane protein YdiY
MLSRRSPSGLAIFGMTCLVVAAGFSRVFGDVVTLNNGDQVTGTIATYDGTNLTINSVPLGSVNVALKDVKTFSTDGPIKIVLQDGTVLNEKIADGPAGEIMLVPGGPLAQQNIPLSQVTKINPPPVMWTGSIVATGLWALGNTNSTQFGINLDLSRVSDQDRITASAGYLFGSEKVNGIESTTQDNWFLKGEYDYFFTPKLFGYANSDIEEDRILDLRLRVTPGVGLGYQWVERPDFNVNTDLGAAWVYEDYSTLPKPNENVSARVAYHVDKSFFDGNVKIFNDLEYFPSVQNVSVYLLLADAGVRVAMTKNMFSELKAQVNYDSKPGPGTTRTDQKYTLGVGWTF